MDRLPLGASKIVYFSEVGEKNTNTVLKIAKEKAEDANIKSIVVASTRGETGVKAAKLFKGYNLVIVTHVTGHKSPDTQELTEENRKEIIKYGGKILTTTHAFGGAGRAVRKKFDTMQVDEIMANILRMFGEGMKVACEISLMAADAGLVRTDENAIAIAGSSRGCDTAIIVRPANVHALFELRVKEILCKPRV